MRSSKQSAMRSLEPAIKQLPAQRCCGVQNAPYSDISAAHDGPGRSHPHLAPRDRCTPQFNRLTRIVNSTTACLSKGNHQAFVSASSAATYFFLYTQSVCIWSDTRTLQLVYPAAAPKYGAAPRETHAIVEHAVWPCVAATAQGPKRRRATCACVSRTAGKRKGRKYRRCREGRAARALT